MTEQHDKQIKLLSVRLIHTLDGYMDNHDGQKESDKLAVVMSALTRVLGTMAASMGVPLELMTKALEADMRTAHEAMAQDETKH
jgi:hypothetical protein